MNNDNGSNWDWLRDWLLIVCVNYALWLILSSTCHFLTNNSLQSSDKDQQESLAVAEKPHDVVVKLNTIEIYSGIARSSCNSAASSFIVLIEEQRSSMTLRRTSKLLTFAVQLIFAILLHNHISNASIFLIMSKSLLHTRPHSTPDISEFVSLNPGSSNYQLEFLADRTATQYDRLYIVVILSSVCLSVTPSVCDTVHSSSQGWCTGLKVVPACF